MRVFFQNVLFVMFAVMMDMALFAQTKSTEGKALLQALHLHRMTEVRERASVRVGGENEGNEVDRVGGSEFCPSSVLSTSRMMFLRGALLLHMHAHLVLSL
jgi:hypothetical protein